MIDELKVISFDRFQMKLPSSVQYDDLIRIHLAYYRHYNSKRALIRTEYLMPDISHLPALCPPSATEEKQLFYPTGGRYGQSTRELIETASPIRH